MQVQCIQQRAVAQYPLVVRCEFRPDVPLHPGAHTATATGSLGSTRRQEMMYFQCTMWVPTGVLQGRPLAVERRAVHVDFSMRGLQACSFETTDDGFFVHNACKCVVHIQQVICSFTGCHVCCFCNVQLLAGSPSHVCLHQWSPVHHLLIRVRRLSRSTCCT